MSTPLHDAISRRMEGKGGRPPVPFTPDPALDADEALVAAHRASGDPGRLDPGLVARVTAYQNRRRIAGASTPTTAQEG